MAVRLQGCQGYAPAYTAAQQKQLRGVLSAVRAVFSEASDPILDRTTGTGSWKPPKKHRQLRVLR